MAESDALPALRQLLSEFDGSQEAAEVAAAKLDALSNLPGPRANLAVASAFADEASPELVLALADSDLEYVRMCAVVGLGRLWARRLVEPARVEARLRSDAADSRWRVREGVAMALQVLGDRDPPALRAAVAQWSASPDPYVVRAAIAGICEPRLLRESATANAALDACDDATRLLRSIPSDRRRRDDARTLRQALGYCWSVAIAACPDPGLARFRTLDDADADVSWVLRENLKKARLRRVVGDG